MSYHAPFRDCSPALLIPAILLAAALAFVPAGCGDRGGRSVSVVGSTSIQPFAEELSREFRVKHPEIRVQVQGGGSTAGLLALTSGIAEIGTCSRSLCEDELKSFTPITIARDGLAVVVHCSNPVNNLTSAQVLGLFSGRITNWKELGGADMKVTLVVREEGSGTRDAFTELVMGKARVPLTALVQQSNGAVREIVRNDPGGVSYMSLGMAGTDVKAVAIDGVEPTVSEVRAGRYRLARPFLFVTKGTPTPDAQQFIDFVFSPEGQGLLEKEGLVRVR